METKPKCKLLGKDSNIFNLMGLAKQTLQKANQKEQATEMINKVAKCGSYDEAIAVISDYVEVY